MKRMKYAVLALLAVCLLGGCAKEKTAADPAENENTPVMPEDAEEEPDLLSELSDTRYDGYEYRILVRKGHTSTQYFDAMQDDVVDNAIYLRNKAVEDRYGVTITCAEGEGDNTDTSALNAILAGDDAYDVIFTHSRSAFSYAVQGACLNINDIPSIYPDKPWWSKNCAESCDINGRLYVMDGDISINGLGFAMCLLFNKNIFDELGFEYPYELVEDGEWTFDRFAYYAKKGGMDLNGDGVLTPNEDRFGFVADDWTAPIAVLYAGGQKVYDKAEDGSLDLTLFSSKTADIFGKFFMLMDNSACYLNLTENSPLVGDPFGEGRAMFLGSQMGSAKAYRNMDDDFGILPYPVFDEGDAYHSVSNGFSPLMVIPLTVSDPERTGAITEALAAYGHEYVMPAFYDVALKSKYARDESSERMMDIIKNGLMFDIGYLCGGSYQSHGHDLANTPSHDFASWYNARESQERAVLAAFNRDYGGIEE